MESSKINHHFKQLTTIYETLINEIDVGVHVINDSGKTIIYNNKMSEIESLTKEDVINKDFLDIFRFEDGQKSTLLEALYHNKEIKNVKQTYFTKKGKAITTINNTFPIYENEKVIGAIEIAKDVTKIENLLKNNMNLKSNTRYTFDSLIGESDAIKEVIEIAKRATRTPSSVLIIGETGTGKELFAQSIHNGSEHSSGPFISQNCAAMPETLIESILFGTKKGAFTGATERIGLFEQAEGGTLLLDEINSLSPMLQAKLLRAIQEKSIRRIGDTVDRKVNVRIISTINEDPVEAIANNRLRKDLYYRLSVVSLFIPSLKERKGDIHLLINHFIQKYNQMFQMDVKGVNENVMKIFEEYEWPGNVRELEHVIEGAMNLVVDEPIIEVSHLPFNFRNKSTLASHQEFPIVSVHDMKTVNKPESIRHLKDYLLNAEEYYIKKVLEKNNYHKTRTAQELGLSRQTLQYRINRLNINS
ncbi:sigma-54 interaction domain-containing protein [Metabacillus sediminilitoris]|uniref:PAS domain S-box protein n=1 Tax=Metabacillus sediminilitoris TaxID=2567941 RepID=A0A4S4C0J5_9BACI|nr:sigma 54-interacting transcriptional regulator [Metabacillus sediminilitoris]QGQ47759.1 PAS domain S-box protein [Metabacillus sediminilitoris]THF81128.1 PAS domain S-box protein [Metabacillus sediminilitoris]